MCVLDGMIQRLEQTFRDGNYKTSVDALKQVKNFKLGALKTKSMSGRHSIPRSEKMTNLPFLGKSTSVIEGNYLM